ncbi:MAG: hypothetical protein NC410_00030 [Oscillibacter sp.]|nr:hypothetical protein [Oscillibacter sp.]
MKKTKRKILFLTAIIVGIIIVAISYNDHSSFSSDIISPEALAASENGNHNCSDGDGFCIIDGVLLIGVTYKE